MNRRCLNSITVMALLAIPAPGALSVPVDDGTTAVSDQSSVESRLSRFGALFERLAQTDGDPQFYIDAYAPETVARIGAERLRMVCGMFRKDLAGATVEAVRGTGASSGSILVYSAETGLGASLDVDFEVESPYRVVGLNARLENGNPHVAGIENGMSPDAMVKVLDPWLDELSAADQFSGAVLLARGGVPIYRRAIGFASRAHAVPNRVNTLFNLGSINKMFTAVAILQLVERGALDLEATLGEVLPDYPNQEVAETVRIRHLLSHTSGLGDFWEAMFEIDWTRLRTPSDHLPLFCDDPLLFEPGQRFSYSNAGFVVLGLVIEEVTSQSYYDYVREHIYAPAGMSRSGSFAVDEIVENLASGYTRAPLDDGDSHNHQGEGELRSNLFLHRARGGPAGGGYTTVDDMLGFANALLGFELIDQDHTEEMFTPRVATPWGDEYGYGCGVTAGDGPLRIGHNGGAPGINALFEMYPRLGYTLVVLSNSDEGAMRVGRRVSEMIARSDS